MDLLADSENFPENWLFKYRWGKGKKEASVLPNGEKISFVTVGGRTSAIVPSVQKKAGTSTQDGNGTTTASKRKKKAPDSDAEEEKKEEEEAEEDEEEKEQKAPPKKRASRKKDNNVENGKATKASAGASRSTRAKK